MNIKVLLTLVFEELAKLTDTLENGFLHCFQSPLAERLSKHRSFLGMPVFRRIDHRLSTPAAEEPNKSVEVRRLLNIRSRTVYILQGRTTTRRYSIRTVSHKSTCDMLEDGSSIAKGEPTIFSMNSVEFQMPVTHQAMIHVVPICDSGKERPRVFRERMEVCSIDDDCSHLAIDQHLSSLQKIVHTQSNPIAEMVVRNGHARAQPLPNFGINMS